MKNIVLIGGGTAGHVMPNLAIAEDLRKYFDGIYYMGERGGIEETLALSHGLPFYGTDAVKLKRGAILSNISLPFKLLRAVNQAEKVLKEIKPSIVFAKGGYASLPSALSARRLGIKVIIHESDLSLGLANKLCKPFAHKVLTSFKDTCKGEIVVGNPVRKEIFEGKDPQIYFSEPKPIILVMGGSKGSRAINECIKTAIDNLSEYNIIHIVGESPVDIRRDNYYSIRYSDQIQDLYYIADVVITRGGANALSEITALGKRALVIPLPKGASRGDQCENADYYARLGFVDVLPEIEMNSDTLVDSIKKLMDKPSRGINTVTANDRIIQEIIDSI